MPFAQNEDPVEALSAHASQEALADRVHIRGAKGGFDDPDAHALRGPVEVETEFAVAIPDEHLRPGAERRGVSRLLGRPLLARGTCNGDVHDGSSIDVNYEECE
jgi:hypothetical protein